MNADAGPTAVAIVGIQGAMPQTFLARLLPLERPITRVPIPPSLRNIERLDTSLCQHTRGTSRDMGRRPCHAPRFTAGPRPDPKSTKLACMPRPTPGMPRTAMLLDARRADLERIRLVPATGAGLRLAILRRGSIGLVWKLAMVGSFGRPIARHNSVGLPPNSPTPSRSELLVVVAGVALIALAVLAL